MKPINPYYSLGNSHNECLDYLSKKLSPSSTSQDIIDEVVNFYISLYPKENSLNKVLVLKRNVAEVLNFTKSYPDEIPFKANYLQKKFYTEFLSIDKMQPELVVNYLRDFENRIIYSELTWKEQYFLLICSAVGTSSAKYWLYQYNNYDKSPWKNYCDYNSFLLKLPRWLKCDAIGAGIGAIYGSTVVGPGTAVGAVIGGAAASFASLVYD